VDLEVTDIPLKAWTGLFEKNLFEKDLNGNAKRIAPAGQLKSHLCLVFGFFYGFDLNIILMLILDYI
jgi:hypothetical protein